LRHGLYGKLGALLRYEIETIIGLYLTGRGWVGEQVAVVTVHGNHERGIVCFE
jgi:hypothetical protein